MDSAPDDLPFSPSLAQDPLRSTPSCVAAAAANGGRATGADRDSKRSRWTDSTAPGPSPPAATARFGRTRDDLALPPVGGMPTRASPGPPPPLPPLRTATSAPSSWLRLHCQVNGGGGRGAAADDERRSNRYTSIRELLLHNPSPSTTEVDPLPAAANLLSPRHHQNHPVSPNNIAIRNHLVKHAAYAYLRPTVSPAPEPRRSWLPRPPHRHPDDDGRSWDDYCAGGGGLLCGGVGVFAGWVAGVMRCFFARVIGQQTTGKTRALDWTGTNGKSEQQHQP